MPIFNTLPMRFKKLHTPRISDLVEGVKDHRCHSAFMIFIRSIYIKKFASYPKGWFLLLGQCPQVKLMFTLPIRIQGF